MSPELSHFAEASKVATEIGDNGHTQRSSFLAEAQLHATLAVAYEQRTANLIAYQANVEESYSTLLKRPRSEQANALNQQIIERLGLK